MTMKNKMKDFEDMLKRAEENPEFAAKLQSKFVKTMSQQQKK